MISSKRKQALEIISTTAYFEPPSGGAVGRKMGVNRQRANNLIKWLVDNEYLDKNRKLTVKGLKELAQ